MNNLEFDTDTRPSRRQRQQPQQGGSVWLPIIAVLLLLQLLLIGRSFWFVDYRLDRIDNAVRYETITVKPR